MIEEQILKTLQKRLATVVDGQYKVKYLGRNITPPNKTPWWEVVFIPNNASDQFWGSEKVYRGLFRLILHWPQDDKGAYEYLAEAARVAAGFAKGSRLQYDDSPVITITDHPNVMSPIEEPPQTLVAISIRYECLTIV